MEIKGREPLKIQLFHFYQSLLGGTGQRKSGKFLQKQVPNYLPFPCQTQGYRSTSVPESVHQLRPGISKY